MSNIDAVRTTVVAVPIVNQVTEDKDYISTTLREYGGYNGGNIN